MITTEMMERGEWWVPIQFGEPSFYKPPLHYWLMLSSFKIFGYGAFATYFPSVLMLFGLVLILGGIVRELRLPQHPLWHAGMMFALTVGALVFGTTAQMEVDLCFFYFLSWWASLRLANTEKTRWIYLMWISAGVLGLIKSPVYSVFWAVGYALFLLVNRRFGEFKKKHQWIALIIGVAIAGSWYLAMLKQFPNRFWWEFFDRENLQKIGGNGGTPASIWLAAMYFIAPFTLFIFPAIKSVVKEPWEKPQWTFLVAAALPPALFFSFYPYRNTPYLFVITPLFIVWFSRLLFENRPSDRNTRWTLRTTSFLLFIVCGVGALLSYRLGIFPDVIPIAFLVLCILWVVVSLRARTNAFFPLAFVTLFFVRSQIALLGEIDIQGLRQVLKYVNGPVAMWVTKESSIWHEVGMLSASIEKPMVQARSVEDMAKVLRSEGIIILRTDEAQEKILALQNALTRVETRSLESFPWYRFHAKKELSTAILVSDFRDRSDALLSLAMREYQIIYLRKW